MGSPEPRETPIDPFCICRAEQDCIPALRSLDADSALGILPALVSNAGERGTGSPGPPRIPKQTVGGGFG
jgi:hypothetical protein